MEAEIPSKASNSPFFDPGPLTSPDNLALLPLRRDLIQPTILSAAKDAVCNTRFGTYPHSTLLGIPWGSQVLASKIAQQDQKRRGKKRKAEELADDEDGLVILGDAGSGFTHVLPPTPELWTQSLPHRTQVVYTPDYSYILHRLRVRPGSVVIEAGAGSGSFTHAAARAVYSPENGANDIPVSNGMSKSKRKGPKRGKVCSFEYHKPRATQLAAELRTHGLGDVVTVTNRDVYEHGFNLSPTPTTDSHTGTVSPEATAIFLDLPAPWLALKHLRRSTPPAAATETAAEPHVHDGNTASTLFTSPLSKTETVSICTFSPCIEQVSKTVSALRELGWTDIDMVELAHRHLNVRRVRYGVAEEGSRDGNPAPASVEEAVARLRGVKDSEEKGRAAMKERETLMQRELGVSKDEAKERVARALKEKTGGAGRSGGVGTKEERLLRLERERNARNGWREGRLELRTEPELKGHTSYLVFATLPVDWTAEDEERAARKVAKLAEEK